MSWGMLSILSWMQNTWIQYGLPLDIVLNVLLQPHQGFVYPVLAEIQRERHWSIYSDCRFISPHPLHLFLFYWRFGSYLHSHGGRDHLRQCCLPMGTFKSNLELKHWVIKVKNNEIMKSAGGYGDLLTLYRVMWSTVICALFGQLR